MRILEGIPMEGAPWFDEKRWVSPLNFMPEVYGGETSKEVYVHDVTLRDGEQTCGLNWTEQERVDVALMLNDLGVKSIEVGMPIISEDIVSAIQKLVKKNLKSELIAFCRARRDDIECAAETGVEKIIIEHAVNPYTNYFAYNITTDQLIERISSSVNYAKSLGLRVTFMGWDVTRTTIDYLKKVYSIVVRECQPEAVVFTDSFGVATPNAIYHSLREMKKALGDVPIEFHVHNEFGMAMGSVMAAAYAGISGIHSSLNGLGERTGNVATEEVAAALEILLGINTGISLEKIDEITRRVAEISRIPIPYNKPVTGTRLFWMESGVVVQAKRRLEKGGINAAMFPYVPELVGREPAKVVLGGSSGKESVIYFLEKYGLECSEEELKELVEMIKDLGRRKRDVVSEEEFLGLYKKVRGEA